MKIFICANGYTDTQTKQAIDCAEKLKKLGHLCSVDENPKLSYFEFPVEDSDLVMSLGGDGALLRASKIALQYHKPLIGVNSGRLGYLCAMALDDIDDFDNIINQVHLEDRTMLEIVYKGRSYFALNDIIVSKTDFGKTVDLTVNCNNKELLTTRSDGLIIATPTGSTAYNISAGGPILDLDGNMLVVTPICPHLATSHPYVINDDKNIEIIVNHDDIGIFADGVFISNTKDKINIVKAKEKLKLYCK